MSEDRHDHYSDHHLRRILNGVRSIAVVGASPKTIRPSYFVVKYLAERGYRVLPINPGHAGGEICGCKVHASLADLPEPVDMVDIFRSSEAAYGVVEESLALEPRPKVVWMQLGVRNDGAAALAEEAGIEVVMNRCPKIEYGRLSGEIGWAGVNRRTISSRRPARTEGRFQQLSIPGRSGPARGD